MSKPESSKSPRLPPRWVIRSAWAVHRGLFRLSGGRFGLRRATADTWGMFRLTATGRRSGEQRSVILGYFEDGPNLVTMAMNGWGAPEPAWWLNVQANPVATVEVRGGRFEARAHAAEGDERDRLWERWRHYDKGLDGYASLRPTETAVVVLEPIDTAA
ncbi:MAG: nitroreductase/quinone reductase family protein [Acidimicrobiia bacterium]